MIGLHHIIKRCGSVLALDDVSLTISRGERLGIVGENGAGKSSLMNVLYGLYQPDSGHISLNGAPIRLKTPADARAHGIAMVQQHFTLVPTLTVAENVVLGHEPTKWGRLDLATAIAQVNATAAKLGFTVDPRAVVGELTVGTQQKVEIIKALHTGATTLILDEPTAVLTPSEAQELYAVARTLAEQGVGVIVITHKLREVLAFAQRIAVMRRGKLVSTHDASVSESELAHQLTGDTVLAESLPREERAAGDVRLELRGVSAEKVSNLSLQVRAGEIVGIAGVDGNGQRELAQVLTGLRPFTGEFRWEGQVLQRPTPRALRDLGLRHIPEDRLRQAIVGELSLEENLSLGQQTRAPFAKGGLIDRTRRRSTSERLLKEADVRPPDPAFRAGSLSGGNQQKLVVARELATTPSVLVVVQPTRGLDIAAVHAVRQRLMQARNAGTAVVVVSLDLDEVLALADRVLVMFAGKVSGAFSRAAFDEQAIGRCMLGVARG